MDNAVGTVADLAGDVQILIQQAEEAVERAQALTDKLADHPEDPEVYNLGKALKTAIDALEMASHECPPDGLYKKLPSAAEGAR